MSYAFELVRSGLETPRKITQLLLTRDMLGWIRTEFLGAAAQIGVLAALAVPRTTEELAQLLGARDPAMLSSFLDLGVAVGELRRRDGKWALRGKRARALADPALDGISALLEEAVTYDGDVYRALRRRLHGEPPGDYLSESAETVARASRMAEVVLAPFVRHLVRRYRPRRILDVGCGSGVYLRTGLEGAPGSTAVGIDVQPSVVAAARRNMEAWGVGARAAIREADIRTTPDLGGPFDLVLLFQNIYYFPTDDRPALLATLRQLAPDGIVTVATAVANAGDPLASHLDVVLRSTAGNEPLPTAADVRSALTAVGFPRIEERRLAPRQPIRAFVAHSGS